MERDPRIDPKPGDVVKLAPFDEERTVVAIRPAKTMDGIRICAFFSDDSYTTVKYGMRDAEIIHVAGEVK